MIAHSNSRIKSTSSKILIIAILLIVISMMAFPSTALGESISDTSTELSEKQKELEDIKDQINSQESEIASLNESIEELSNNIIASQKEALALSDHLAQISTELYKNDGNIGLLSYVVEADNITDIVKVMEYLNDYATDISDTISQQKSVQEQLENDKSDLNAKIEEKQASIDSLNDQADKIESEVSELKQEISASQPAGTAFATGDTTGWLSGTASAYGGSSDASTGSVSHTATGDICDDSSMGVAVPMSMPNYRSYFGRKVEISYNGKSVIATVNDCGGMGGGSRVLDLQPGVFKTLGFSSCQDWGLRTVSYRFL